MTRTMLGASVAALAGMLLLGMDGATAQNSTPARGTSASVQKPIYEPTLRRTGNNWSAGTPGASVNVRGRALEVNSDQTLYSYVFASNDITVRPGATYTVNFDIRVTKGAMFVGVLDVEATKFIAQELVTDKPGVFSFRPDSRRVKLIFSNNAVTGNSTSATVSRLSVSPSR